MEINDRKSGIGNPNSSSDWCSLCSLSTNALGGKYELTSPQLLENVRVVGEILLLNLGQLIGLEDP